MTSEPLAGVRFGLIADGLLLPSGDGATNRFLGTLRLLSKLGADVYALHGYRGWSSLDLLRREPFKTVLIDPAELACGGGALRSVLTELKLDWIQSKEPEFMAMLASSGVLPDGTKLIFECHDIPAEPSKLRRTAIAASLADLVVTLTLEDRSYLHSLIDSTSPILCVPCYIDEERLAEPIHHGKGASVVFLGHMYYEPNAESIEAIVLGAMRNVWLKRPDVELHIVGDAPLALRERWQSNKVIFHGYVSDPVAALRNFDVALSILARGTGFRVKVLDYCAAGLPIVTNALGLQGFVNSGEFAVTETIDGAAESVLAFLNDPAARTEAALRQQGLVRSNHSSAKLASVYTSALHAQGGIAKKDAFVRSESVRRLGGVCQEEVQALASSAQPWMVEVLEKGRFPTSTSFTGWELLTNRAAPL